MRAILGETAGAPAARFPWWACAAEGLALAALAPLAAAVAASLASDAGGSGYAHWWGTALGWQAMWRTVRLAALAATMAAALAWAIAASAGRLPGRWAAAAAYLACLPMLVPSSLMASAWIAALGRQGAVARALEAVSGGWRPDVFSLPAAALVMALRYFGLAALVFLYARRRREADWPAARVFRVPRLAAAVQLHLRPAVGPTAAAWLLVMLFCMNDPIIPGMFLVSTYGTQVLIQYTALLDPAGAAALAVPMAAVGAAALAAALRLARRDWTGLDSPASDVRPVRRAAGQVIVAAVAAAVLAAALAVPIVALAYKAGSWGALADALVSARQQAWQTLVLALAAGAACMAAGAALAARWVGAWRAGRPTAVPLVLLNLTVPPSLLGIGVIQLAQAPPLEALGDTSWPLVLAYVARFLPVATLVCYALWRGEPREPVLAARVHGLSPWRTAWRVLWPMRRATIAAAGLLAALLVATELEVSILLAPPGGSTLGVRLYTLIHTAPETVTGALALDILLLAGPAILLLGLLLWLVRRPAAGEA